MKSFLLQGRAWDGTRGPGFTLPELLITMGLFSMVALVGIYTHVFGLKMNELTETRMGNGPKTRSALNSFVEEVRTARRVILGSGDALAFTEIGFSSVQEGNAIQLYPTENTNLFIRYFLDDDTQKLKRMETNGNIQVVAGAISNEEIFSSEDSYGNQLQNNRNNRVIVLTLNFSELDSSRAPLGPDFLYDAYQVKLKVTPRTLE